MLLSDFRSNSNISEVAVVTRVRSTDVEFGGLFRQVRAEDLPVDLGQK